MTKSSNNFIVTSQSLNNTRNRLPVDIDEGETSTTTWTNQNPNDNTELKPTTSAAPTIYAPGVKPTVKWKHHQMPILPKKILRQNESDSEPIYIVLGYTWLLTCENGTYSHTNTSNRSFKERKRANSGGVAQKSTTMQRNLWTYSTRSNQDLAIDGWLSTRNKTSLFYMETTIEQFMCYRVHHIYH